MTQMKVTVLEAAEEEAVNGVPRDKPKAPTAGKTYVPKKGASGTAVTDEAGDAAPMRETVAIIAQLDDFGQVNPVLEAMRLRGLDAWPLSMGLEGDVEGTGAVQTGIEVAGKPTPHAAPTARPSATSRVGLDAAKLRS